MPVTPLGRSAQLVVNPTFNTAIVAPWVALANVMIQAGGSFTYDTNNSLAQQNGGAYHFIQDVAIPGGDIANVDAGTRVVDFDGYGAMVNAGSTGTMYLEARDAGGAVLQRWQLVLVQVAGKPYQQFTVRMAQIPAGTRTLRIGVQGNNAFAGVWFDNFSLYLDDLALALTKAVGYVVPGQPIGRILNTKALGYLVEGMGFAAKLQTSKSVLYAVTAASHTLALLKGVVYVVSRPVPGYGGVVLACGDRPTMNVFTECGARPASAIEACSPERPDDSFFTDNQPFRH